MKNSLQDLQLEFRGLALKIMSDFETLKTSTEDILRLSQITLKDFERLDKLYKAIMALQSLVEGE